MQALRVSLIILILCSGLFAQSFYMEQETTSSGMMGMGGGTSVQKFWYTKDKIRIESPKNDQVTILRFDIEKVYLISPKKKTYAEMSLDEFRQLAKMGMAMLKQAGAPVKVRKTGETKTINGYKCYAVEVDNSGMKQKMWFSKDLKIGKDLYFEYLKKMPEVAEAAEMIYKDKEIEGVPVLTETEISVMGNTIKSTTKLLKIEKTNPPAGLFELPSGLKKVANPLEQMQKGMQGMQ